MKKMEVLELAMMKTIMMMMISITKTFDLFNYYFNVLS
jgi:hypothetical protein